MTQPTLDPRYHGTVVALCQLCNFAQPTLIEGQFLYLAEYALHLAGWRWSPFGSVICPDCVRVAAGKAKTRDDLALQTTIV